MQVADPSGGPPIAIGALPGPAEVAEVLTLAARRSAVPATAVVVVALPTGNVTTVAGPGARTGAGRGGLLGHRVLADQVTAARAAQGTAGQEAGTVLVVEVPAGLAAGVLVDRAVVDRVALEAEDQAGRQVGDRGQAAEVLAVRVAEALEEADSGRVAAGQADSDLAARREAEDQEAVARRTVVRKDLDDLAHRAIRT